MDTRNSLMLCLLLCILLISRCKASEVGSTGKPIRVQYSANLTKNEIEAKDFKQSDATESGYESNCISILIVSDSHAAGENAVSINFTLHYLDIDSAAGEYLLIGSGPQPFHGPPPLMVANENTTKKYYVNDVNAYIAFVSAETSGNRSGFKITWEYNKGRGKIEIEKKDPKGYRQDDVLQSVPLCIYNVTAAFREFNQTESFKEFREELAYIATETFRKGEKNISSSRIQLYRISALIPEEPSSERLAAGALYVMLKVPGDEEGAAEFRSDELRDILDTWEDEHGDGEVRGFKIGRCMRTTYPKSWAYIGFYTIIPGICVVILVIWTWDYNPLSAYFKSGPYKKPPLQKAKTGNHPISENEYVASVPKFILTDHFGRRHTLYDATDEQDDVLFSGYDFKRRAKHQSKTSESESGKGSQRKGKYSAVNYGFENTEGQVWDADEELIDAHQESEHVYDSVDTSERNVQTEETKL